MTKDYQKFTPTMQAINDVAAKEVDARTQAIQEKISRLYNLRGFLLSEISPKHPNAVNEYLQDAMGCIDSAITEIQVTEQRMKSETGI